MTARRMLVGALVMAIVLPLIVRAQTPTGQTVFRSSTDLVSIDVAVRASGTPVGGLTAKDFALVDNGVAQQVEAVELEAVPVDITVLIEATDDVAPHAADQVEQARQIAAMARPTDRVRVMRIGPYISDVLPAQPSSTLPPVPDLVPFGIPAAYDGLAAALLRRVEPDRRHLIIAITNGIDNISALDLPTLAEIAKRSSATLHVAQIDIAFDDFGGVYRSGRERLAMHKGGAAMLTAPSRPLWRPYDDQQFDALGAVAASTGGEVHLPGVFRDRNALAVFDRVFSDYRRNYVLRYTPQGVARTGWHDVTVTIPKNSSMTIRARRGYFVDVDRPAGPTTPATTPVPAAAVATTPPTTLDALTTAYDSADYAAVVAGLREADAPGAGPGLATLIGDFERGGNPWPASPHREAAFVLELAEAGLLSQNREARAETGLLLERHGPLVRHPLGPDAFERNWLWAGLSLFEAAREPASAQRFASAAVARLPGEPRFLLARAILADQRQPADVLSESAPGVSSHIKDVAALYDAAMGFETTATEARVRKAWLLHRAGHDSDAWTLLEAAADTPDDRALSYLRLLFRARTLTALGRPDAAAAAMNAAETILGALRQAGDGAADPWRDYWTGDYRFFLDLLAKIREQSR